MTTFVLQFNATAVESLGDNTRLRVKMIRRGGKDYLALRPSYRVSGKNQMVRVSKSGDQVTAEIPLDLLEKENLPKLEEGAVYYFTSIGYGWYLLKKQTNEEPEAKVSVSIKSLEEKKQKQDDPELDKPVEVPKAPENKPEVEKEREVEPEPAAVQVTAAQETKPATKPKSRSRAKAKETPQLKEAVS